LPITHKRLNLQVKNLENLENLTDNLLEKSPKTKHTFMHKLEV